MYLLLKLQLKKQQSYERYVLQHYFNFRQCWWLLMPWKNNLRVTWRIQT